jgi:ketosteroid isomerase-like protein
MTDGSEQEIIELARARSGALVEKDLDTLTSLLAEDFVYTNADGVLLARNDYLTSYVDTQGLVWSSQTLDELQVRHYGEAAVLTCRVHDVASASGSQFDAWFRSTFLYARLHGVWTCAAGHTTAISPP